jgi:hypothetical protein
MRVLLANAITGYIVLLAAGSSFGGLRVANCQGGLKANFYAQSCPNAEALALQTLQSSLFMDIIAPAALLRLVFHDCQVQVHQSRLNSCGQEKSLPRLSTRKLLRFAICHISNFSKMVITNSFEFVSKRI